MAEATPNTETKLVKMELLRNYVPRHEKDQKPVLRIVGYNRPEKKARDSAGREHIIQSAEFIPGEMMPPTFPGVGFETKVWAGTVIEVPEDEAKDMRSRRIADVYL